jgi:choline dehydrogenase-like flavoprotein
MATVAAAQAKLAECLADLGYERNEPRKENPRGDHASGVCRMGHSPDSSVTDGNLVVHGIENLFVCSNAVLPNAAAVNPTLTLAALALRLGSWLAEGSRS